MRLYMLFAQRKCNYPGEYAPEVLEVCDEFSMDENPEWLQVKYEEALANSEFSSAAIVQINLDGSAEKEIDRRLNDILSVKAEVEESDP